MPRSPLGPIAKKVQATLRKVKQEKLVDLTTWKAAKVHATDLAAQSPMIDPEVGRRYPEFAGITQVTNWVLTALELMQDLPALAKFTEKVSRFEEEYMPEGPPMSPLTRSFFWQWMLYDLPIGVQRETFGSILLALAPDLKIPDDVAHVLALLVESRLGLYVVDRVDGDNISLRELVTERRCVATCPSGYVGKVNDLWLVRLVPPPLEGARWTVVMTPYLILRPVVAEWQSYLDRTLPLTGVKERTGAYESLMKHGLEPTYWAEYVFEAYANHQDGVILLMGLPDVEASRPNSPVSA